MNRNERKYKEPRQEMQNENRQITREKAMNLRMVKYRKSHKTERRPSSNQKHWPVSQSGPPSQPRDGPHPVAPAPVWFLSLPPPSPLFTARSACVGAPRQRRRARPFAARAAARSARRRAACRTTPRRWRRARGTTAPALVKVGNTECGMGGDGERKS